MPTSGDFATAFALMFKMVVCAGIGFAGGYMILSALFARRISGREAFLLTAGLFALLFFSVSLMLRGGPGILLLLIVVVGIVVLFHALARAADRRIVKGLVDEDIAKYRDALEIDPDNTAAHSLLADTYRGLGRLESAIEEYEAALRLDPSLRQERYWLQRLKSELESREERELLCPRCRTPRPEGAGSCPECARVYSAWEVWRHAFRTMEPARQAILTGVGVGTAGVIFAIVALAPGAAKLISMMVILLAPVAVFLLTARAGRRGG
ncbi:MAG: tetratricopeptide repeat protein [Armatimonadota bacterium]|nr:tetratricopeptide repeat protein [Armatimonadota bacterium]